MQEEVLPIPRESFNLEPTANRLVKPLISVILATKGNKSMLLERCIISLQNQTFQEFEIVLVYSIFPKQLSQLLETGNIVTLKETSSTLGAARNLGVKHAKAELVAFIDDDAEAPEDWLKKIYSTFQQDPSLFCLGGPHLTPIEESKKSPLIFVQGSFLESHLKGKYFDRSAVGKIAGCNVTYRKIVFDKIGYLDEKLKSGEDVEFHQRLAENGYRLCFDPEISVLHHRQGLKHTFWNSSKMVPFYLSWKTLKYAKYDSFIASFYLTNLLCLILLIALLISPFVFFLLLLSSLLGYFTFTAVRMKTYNWRIIYYPLMILVSLVRIIGFCFGLSKYIVSEIHYQLVALWRRH